MFVANFDFPTGERLTRYRQKQRQFATAQDAIDAIAAPFPPRCVSAVAIEIYAIGKCRVLAKRNRGRALLVGRA